MTLPPLPDDRRYSHDAHYSADQMRAYGEACAAAERERCLRVVYDATDWASDAMLAYGAACAAAERERAAEIAESFDACDTKHIAAAIRAHGIGVAP